MSQHIQSYPKATNFVGDVTGIPSTASRRSAIAFSNPSRGLAKTPHIRTHGHHIRSNKFLRDALGRLSMAAKKYCSRLPARSYP
eukprot:12339677-Karenia_brevis.AAC.1